MSEIIPIVLESVAFGVSINGQTSIHVTHHICNQNLWHWSGRPMCASGISGIISVALFISLFSLTPSLSFYTFFFFIRMIRATGEYQLLSFILPIMMSFTCCYLTNRRLRLRLFTDLYDCIEPTNDRDKRVYIPRFFLYQMQCQYHLCSKSRQGSFSEMIGVAALSLLFAVYCIVYVHTYVPCTTYIQCTQIYICTSIMYSFCDLNVFNRIRYLKPSLLLVRLGG